MRRSFSASARVNRNLLLAATSVAALAALTAAPAWATCDVSWNTAGSGGNWKTAGDWTGGLPQAGDTACIVNGTNTTPTTVTLDSSIPSPTIANLQLGSSDTLDITNQKLAMTGTTLANAGTIAISGTGGIAIEGTITLSGGGNVTLSNSAILQGMAATDSLTNKDNTISGAGVIGGKMFQFTNEATVDANVTGGTLTLADINPVTNAGLLEASNGGILTISLGPTFAVDNSGGTIEAVGGTNGATVNIETEIDGGTLETVGNGVMQTVAGSSNQTLLNGVTLTSGSTYQTTATASAAATTELEGTIVNNGTFAVTAAAGKNAMLTLDGSVILSGSGKVVLGNAAGGTAFIEMAGSNTGTLTNDNDILGSGVIDSSSQLILVNNGTVDASVSGNSITLSSTNITNNGLFEADSGATLNLQSSGLSSLTNYASGKLTGGTYNALNGTIEFGSLGTAGNEITTNSANILLSGANGIIEDRDAKNALGALATNSAGASFATASGQAFSTSANFTNNAGGLVTVGSGSLFTDTHTSSTFTNDGELQGTGTVVANTLFNYGTVKPGDSAGNPGTLSITGNYTQESTGTLDIEIGGTNTGQYGQLNVSGTVNLAGTLAVNLVNGFSLAMGDKFDILNAGTDPGDFSSFTYDGLSCTSGGHDIWDCGGLGSLYFVENFLPGGQELELDVVPEPGSLALIGSGLVAAGWFGRRRKRRA